MARGSATATLCEVNKVDLEKYGIIVASTPIRGSISGVSASTHVTTAPAAHEVCMNGLDVWLRFIAAMSKTILDFVEKRKARRSNGEPIS